MSAVGRVHAELLRQARESGDMTIRPTDKLITYVSRDLEPYRGFHVMMRALPGLMRARKDIKVVMVGGDGISYGAAPHQGGTWRGAMMAEVGKHIDSPGANGEAMSIAGPKSKDRGDSSR